MIVSCVGVKGGIGKSTIAAHLAGFLAERGRSVIVLDSDPQEAVTLWLAEALPHVDVVRAITPDEILDTLPTLKSKAEYVIADGPAGGAEPSRALLLRSDLVLLPCGPSVLDLKALTDTARLVKQAQSIRHGQPEAVVILNRLQPHTNLSRETAEAAPACGFPVARAGLRQRTATADSSGQASFVWRMGYAAREAALDFKTLFREVTNYGQTKGKRGAEEGRA